MSLLLLPKLCLLWSRLKPLLPPLNLTSAMGTGS